MVGGATGLIPSQFLEEKRKAFVPRDFDGSGTLAFLATLIHHWWVGRQFLAHLNHHLPLKMFGQTEVVVANM